MSCDRCVRQSKPALVAAGLPAGQSRAMWAARRLTLQETADRFAIQQRGAASKPALRLQGAWLDRAGFAAGSRVAVEVRPRELVIRPLDDESRHTRHDHEAEEPTARLIAQSAPALRAAGVPVRQAQAAATTPVWRYLPRCARCGRWLPTQNPVCTNPNCGLRDQPQGAPVPWPPPGVTFKRSRSRVVPPAPATPPPEARPATSNFWADHGAAIRDNLALWQRLAPGEDTTAFYQNRARLTAQIACQAASQGEPEAPAGVAQTIAEERARLLLAPGHELSVAERSERLLILDSALALLWARGDIAEEQYRAAVVDILLWATRPPSAAPVTWLPNRPVGGEETTGSQADPTRRITVRYRLVDLNEPTASHTVAGRSNPAYLPELQPRGRERAASQMQIDRIARRLDPEALLRAGASWADGPPIVGPDGMVESGNGRLLALRRAAEINPDGYAQYRAELERRAAGFGLSAAQVRQMRQPILVRERLTEMTAEERRRFVSEANASGVARMGVAEQARADAALIPPGFFADLQVAPSDESLADVLTKRDNLPVVQRFLGLLPETERAALVDAQGHLSAAGIARIERAMFAYVLPGASGQRLADLVFEQAEAIDRIGAGLKRALPALGQAEDLIRAGQRAADLSLGHDLAVTVEKLHDLRKRGLTVNDYLRQHKMFPELTPFQEQLLAQLDGHRRSGQKVATLLSGYAERVLAAPPPNQMAMFDVHPDRESLLRGAVRALGDEWVNVACWSAAQHATAGCGVPATVVERLTRPQQAQSLTLALNERYAVPG